MSERRAKLPRPIPPVLTVGQLATLLHVSPAQVRRMNIPGIEVGRGRWRFVTSQVLEHLSKQAERGLSLVRKAS